MSVSTQQYIIEIILRNRRAGLF